MAQKITNNKRQEIKKEDIVFFKLSSMFFLACAAIIFILKLNDNSRQNNFGVAFYRLSGNSIFIGILAGLFVISLAYYIFNLIKNIDESQRTIASINLVSITAYALCCTLFFRKTNSYRTLLAATVILVLLYFIYYIYRKDFFLFSIANAIFLFALYIWSPDKTANNIAMTIIKILSLAAAAVVLVYIYFISKKSGTDIPKSKTKKSYSKLVYYPIYISAVISAVLILVRYFIGDNVSSMVTMLTMIVQFIIIGVYYTIKLIREV